MQYYGIPSLTQLEEWTALGIPFEYNDFMFPAIVDQKEETERRIAEYMRVNRNRSDDTMHGPFLDITVHSEDVYIRRVSDFRIRQACDIALRLQVKAMIVHTNFIPNFYEPNYRKGWINRNEAYFKALLKDYPTLHIYMENMFDEEPELLAALAERMKGERFGICLDIAHANISKTDISTWQEVCGPYISHYHVNDNDGVIDGHLPIGEGTISWEKVLPSMKPDTGILLEVNSLEKYQKSKAYMFSMTEA